MALGSRAATIDSMQNLQTVTAGGDQRQTQSPQTAGGTLSGSQASAFQSAATNQALVSTNTADNTVSLSVPVLPAIALKPVAAGTTSVYQPSGREFNPGMAAAVVFLLVVAALLFWHTVRNAKNTTI